MFDVRNERNGEFQDYWYNLAREPGELLPRRSLFRPEDIPSLLPNIIVYELLSEDMIRIRLQGTAINQRFGREMTGGNYLDFVAPERREKASRAFWMMAEHPCGMHAILNHRLSNGLDITVESIGFPMLNDSGTAPIIIYQSNEITEYQPYDRRDDDKLSLILVVERNILDLGGGVPDFRD